VQEPDSLLASADTLTAVRNLAVPLRGDTPDHLGWLSGLADRFPRLRTLGVALQKTAGWHIEPRGVTEAQAALCALPVALTRLELDVPTLGPFGHFQVATGINCRPAGHRQDRLHMRSDLNPARSAVLIRIAPCCHPPLTCALFWWLGGV
jgi:hypothetical protein